MKYGEGSQFTTILEGDDSNIYQLLVDYSVELKLLPPDVVEQVLRRDQLLRFILENLLQDLTVLLVKIPVESAGEGQQKPNSN